MGNDGFIEILSPSALAQLKEASEIVDKLVPQIEKISKFKVPTTPSGADNSAKQMELALIAQEKAMEKARIGLQKLSDAQKDAESKRKNSINAEWTAYEKAKNKEKEASDKLLATQIANAEKVAKSEIDKNNKIIQAAEKRAEREKQIEDRKNASILAAQQKQIERQDKIDARNSRTGASSVIPGMGSKISDIKSAEKEAIAAEKAALSNEKLNDAYSKLNKSRNDAARTLKNLIASETASNDEIKQAQKEFDTLNAKVKKADQAVGNFSKNVGNYKSVLSGATQLMSAFGISTGIYLAVDIAKNIYETTKQLQSLDLALKNVSGNQVLYAENQIFIKKTSEDFGIEIKGLQEQFTQFWVASKDKLSGEEIQNIFRSISKAGASMGLSVESQNSAFLALQQMMSKGTVQAEELKKQLGNALPGAFNIMATALGVTEKEMMKMMKAGKILSEDALPKFAIALEKAYGIENINRVETMVASQERLVNSWTNLIRLVTEGDGVISKIAMGSITLLTERLESVHLTLSFLEYQWKRVFGNQSATDSKNKQVNYAIADYKNLSKELNIAIENKDKEIEKLNKLEKIQEKISGNNKQRAQNDIDISKNKLKNLELIIKKEQESLSDKKAEKLLEVNKKITDEEKRHSLVTQNSLKLIEKRDTKKQGTSEWSALNNQIILNNKKIEANNKLLDYNYALRYKLTENVDKKQTTPDSPETTEKEIAARKKRAKELADFEEQLRVNAYQRKISDLERSKEQIKDIKDSETVSLSERLEMEDAFAFKQIQINQAVYDEKIRLAKKEYNEKYALVKGNTEQEAKVLKYRKNQEQIALNELLTSNEDALSESLAKQNKLKEDALKTNLEKTKEWYEKNPPLFLQSKKEKEEAEKIKAILKDLQNEFRTYIQGFQQSFFNQAGFGQSFDFFIKLDEAGKTAFDRINESNLTSKEKFKANFLAISESAQEMFNFISQASQQNYEAEYKRLDDQTAVAIAFAGESQSAQDEINRQAEIKKKEIQRKEFKEKKALAIANIAIDTAQAIMATYGQAGFFGGTAGAIVLAAIGAAQIAMVASQKMPAYKDGTDNHSGGAMLVNDGSGSNYKETIQTPDGKIYQPNQRNVVMNAPKGTKVFTHDQWQRNLDNMLMSNNINYSMPIINNSSALTDNQVDKIVSSIQNKQEYHQTFDKNGIKNYISQGHTQKEILNNQVTFGR